MRYWEPPNQRRSPRQPRPASEPRSAVVLGGSLKDYPFLRRFYQHQAVVGVGLQKFLFFLILATVLYAFVFSDAGIIRIMALKNQKADLELEVAQIQASIASMQAEIELLKDNPFQMEKLARERYGYIYPGDQVIKIVHPEKEKK